MPAPAPPDEVASLRVASRPTLHVEWYRPAAAPRASVVIVHGYAEHCGRYREVARTLTDAGMAVLAFDQRGHGRSDGARGYCSRYEDYLDDLDAALGEADRRTAALDAASTPRFVVAHSHGAVVLLRGLSDPARRPRIAAAVLSSPFLRLRAHVPPVKAAIGALAGRLLPRLSLPNALAPEQLTHDPAKQAERRADTLCHHIANARWFREVKIAQEHIATHAGRIDLPMLWLVGGDDPIADPEAARSVHAKLGKPGELQVLPGLLHEVFNETERPAVLARMREFLVART